MSEKKSDRVERLMRALLVREGELKVAEDVERRAKVRRASLEQAVNDLRGTVRRLIDEDVDDSVAAELEADALSTPDAIPTEETIGNRILDLLEAEPRALDANEISQSLGVTVPVTRSTLSKLHARGKVARPQPGFYRSLLAVEDRPRPSTLYAKSTKGGSQ